MNGWSVGKLVDNDDDKKIDFRRVGEECVTTKGYINRVCEGMSRHGMSCTNNSNDNNNNNNMSCRVMLPSV